MAVDGGYAHWGRPLVVGFVDAFVEARVVEEPTGEGRGGEGRGGEGRQQYY